MGYGKEAIAARKSVQEAQDKGQPLGSDDTSGLEKAQPYGKDAVAARKSIRKSREAWTCPKCDEINKPEREKCNNCGAVKVDDLAPPCDDTGGGEKEKAQPYSKEAVAARKSQLESQENEQVGGGAEKAQPYSKESVAARKSRQEEQDTGGLEK